MPIKKKTYQWYKRKEEQRFSYSEEYKSPRYHKYATFNKGVLVILYWFHTDKPLCDSYERKAKRVLDSLFNATGMGICVADKQKSSRTETKKYFCRIEYYARINHLPTVEEMKEAENLILRTGEDCQVEETQDLNSGRSQAD